MIQFNDRLSLINIQKLNPADYLLLEKINKGTFEEQKFFRSQRVHCDLPYVMRIANVSDKFIAICKQAKYKEFWDNKYQILGALIAGLENRLTLFHIHDDNGFDLLRGAFFFYQSQLVRESSKKIFSFDELSFLEEAIRFNSIHAVQRYNQYLNQKVNKNKIEDYKKNYYLKTALENCKKLIEQYGSYAYMMLGEAYLNYAQLINIDLESHRVSSYYKAAQVCFQNACKYEEISYFSIHNASFGKGIEASNELGLTPSLALDKICFLMNSLPIDETTQNQYC